MRNNSLRSATDLRRSDQEATGSSLARILSHANNLRRDTCHSSLTLVARRNRLCLSRTSSPPALPPQLPATHTKVAALTEATLFIPADWHKRGRCTS